jgi:hypothetical protein
MSFDNVSNNINSAMVSGSLGLQRASDNITQTSLNIAQRSVEPASSQNIQKFLADAASQQLGANTRSLSQQSQGLTADLISLSVDSTNAQASAKVLGVASGTVGTLLDILA